MILFDLPPLLGCRTTLTRYAPWPLSAASLVLERYKVQFTVSADTHAKLRQVQQLLRHRVPNGDPGEIFDIALTMLLAQLQRTKLAATDGPRARNTRAAKSRRAEPRHIPTAVKRDVWARDGGQCAFVGTHGRCSETGFVEFHLFCHTRPAELQRAKTSSSAARSQCL